MKKQQLSKAFAIGVMSIAFAGSAFASTAVGDSAEKAAVESVFVAKDAPKNSLLAKIKSKFGDDIPVVQLTPFAENDLVLIRLVDGSLMYTNDNADYLIAASAGSQPQVYTRDMNKEQVTNLSSAKLSDFNKLLLSGITETIDVKAKNEKHTVYAFVDAACHYCQVLSENLDDYTKLGISFKFVPFPIFGEASETALSKIMSYPADQRFAKLKSSERFFKENKGQKMDFEKMGISDAKGESKATVARSKQIGMAIGVTGTPGLVLSNGELISGLMSPEALISKLESAEKK